MILASHYVIEDLVYSLKGGNLEETRRLCTKFRSRYRNDSDLVGVCDLILNLNEADDESLSDAASKLKELSSARKLETSGGTRLWFEKRR